MTVHCTVTNEEKVLWNKKALRRRKKIVLQSLIQNSIFFAVKQDKPTALNMMWICSAPNKTFTQCKQTLKGNDDL